MLRKLLLLSFVAIATPGYAANSTIKKGSDLANKPNYLETKKKYEQHKALFREHDTNKNKQYNQEDLLKKHASWIYIEILQPDNKYNKQYKQYLLKEAEWPARCETERKRMKIPIYTLNHSDISNALHGIFKLFRKIQNAHLTNHRE